MKLYANEAERAAAVLPKTGRVSCLGPTGSFSEYAAVKMCEGYELVLCHSFTEAVRALIAGETDYAVLPVENSISGGVLECLDLLVENDIFASKEYPIPVDQRLATLEGTRKEDIRYIYSHEQALRQCADYVAQNFPHAVCVPTSATVESLCRLDGQSAGIVGAHVRREGVVLSEENIADAKGNFTRFILVERGSALPDHSVMIFLSAVCSHKPGSLLGLLKIFQRQSLNLTRIESRPVKEAFGVYRFFIEFAGDIGNDRVKKVLEEARVHCTQFKILGAYH